MAFRIPWDETTPLGSYPADVIDDEIRSVKSAISERISQILPGWDNDAEDPKEFPGWFVTLETFTTILDQVLTPVQWDTERRDSGDYISLPNDDVVIIAQRAGLHLIGVEIGWGAVTTAGVEVFLRKNAVKLEIDRRADPTVLLTVVTRILTLLFLEEADVLDVAVFARPGISTSIGTETLKTKFWGLRLHG